MGAQHRTLSVKVFQEGFKGFGQNLAALGFAGLHGKHLAIHTVRLEIVRTCTGTGFNGYLVQVNASRISRV